MRKGLHHVSLKARDEENFEAVLAFYSKELGFPVVQAWGEGEGRGVLLDLGNTLLEIFANGAGLPDKGRFAHIAFHTDDVDGDIAQMRALGRPILMEPRDVELGSGYSARVGFCRGLAGEEIEFFQKR